MNRIVLLAVMTAIILLPIKGYALGKDAFKFVLYYPQVPPYMYQMDQQPEVRGVIAALMNEFFRQQHIKLNYVIDNRNRAEHRLYSGDVDAIMLAKNWTEHPEQLIFSEPVLVHRDFLFATNPIADHSNPADWLNKVRICTRQYYKYEALEPFFAKGSVRIDSSSEAAQMRMLASGRCDYAYMNEHVAAWLQQHQFAELKIYRSPSSFGTVGLTIALNPRWQHLLPKLNQFIKQQRESGSIESMLAKEIQAR